MKDVSHYFSDIDEGLVKRTFEHSTKARLHPGDHSRVCATNVVLEVRNHWHDAVVVFTAGVFDILHSSHLLALTHYRLLGAKEYLRRSGNDTPTFKELQEIAASDNVRLILSVDTDERVASDKAFNPHKGNSPKPLVAWDNRVLLLSQQYITSDNGAHQLIDYITKHGPDACANHEHCAQDDNATIAATLKPDIIVVSSGSPQTISLLNAQKELADSLLVVIDEKGMSYHDKILGGPIKTSSIIQRARAVKETPETPIPLAANTAFG